MSLTEQELDYLESFLISASTHEDCMDIVTLEGFLTALAIGPIDVDIEEWLPMVFGEEKQPAFESIEQENLIESLIIKHFYNIAKQFQTKPEAFVPTLYEIEIGDQKIFSLEEWCSGFMIGVLSQMDDWQSLFEGQYYKLMIPFMLFGTENGFEEILEKEEDQATFLEKWTNTIVPSLVAIHAFWKNALHDENLTESFEHDYYQSAILRFESDILMETADNAPETCPCGSEAAFKLCCGAKNRLH